MPRRRRVRRYAGDAHADHCAYLRAKLRRDMMSAAAIVYAPQASDKPFPPRQRYAAAHALSAAPAMPLSPTYIFAA